MKAKHDDSSAADRRQEQADWLPAGSQEEDRDHQCGLRQPRGSQGGRADHCEEVREQPPGGSRDEADERSLGASPEELLT